VGSFTYKRTYSRTKPDGTSEEFWETVQRVVEGTFMIQKIHCRAMGLPWNEQKAQRSAQDMYRRIWDFKFTPPGRGLWIMGSDLVYQKGGAALNNPLHVDTMVLTKEQGWVPLGTLAGRDEVTLLSSIKLYGRDHTSTGASPTWVKASVSSIEEQPSRRIVFRDNAGYVTEIMASENHRWFSRQSVKHQWERITTMDLQEGHQVPLTMPAKNAPVSIFGAQHGLFFGDGTRSNGELHQFTDSVDVLRDLFGPLAQKADNRRDDEWVVRNCPRGWSKAPEVTEDTSYLYGFLAGYFAADGSVSESGACTLCSSRREELEQIRLLFQAAGVRVGGVRLSSTESNYSDERELWKVSVHNHDLWPEFFLKPLHLARWERRGSSPKRKYAQVVHVEDAGTQQVLCATVPDYEQFVVEGFILTSNCAFVTSEDIDRDFADPFCFLMDMSMLGVGVGGDTRGAGKVRLQAPRVTDEPFVVQDSREGWVDLVRAVLNSFVGKGFYPANIDYSKVRPRGAPLKQFGGKASGAGPLTKLVESVTRLLMPPEVNVGFRVEIDESDRVLSSLATISGEGTPFRITSTHIVDLFNFIGCCVVAGGIRRSAEIMFGEPDDEDFIKLKQDPKALEDRRWVSNNSLFARKGMDYSEIARSIAVNGEPGLVWLDNARQFSRMNGPADNKDRLAMGVNPCVEQTLHNRELCTLVETYPGNHDSYEDYEKTLKMAYLYAKTVTLVPTHNVRTNAVMARNRRIGCSMSGITQAMKKLGRRKFLSWCDKGYGYIQGLDRVYSDWLGIPLSIKTTSVKPSGTVSLLCGATPGIHYPHSAFYIRNIRVANTHLLAEAAKKAGYPVEPDTYADDTVVVSFPVKEEHFSKGKSQVTIWEQFANAAALQRHWADNQVSITVTFRSDEAEDIRTCLDVYEDQLKGLSLLPIRDNGYKQAPYIEITEEEYEALTAQIRPLELGGNTHEMTERFCTNDSCTLPLPKI
jgi:adenosylcobalamin-dependent ribonucleoside-triphosphate reductase